MVLPRYEWHVSAYMAFKGALFLEGLLSPEAGVKHPEELKEKVRIGCQRRGKPRDDGLHDARGIG